MEPVTPLRHLVDMESVIAVVLMVVAAGAGLLFVAAGTFSVMSLLLDELLESDRRPEPPISHLEEAA